MQSSVRISHARRGVLGATALLAFLTASCARPDTSGAVSTSRAEDGVNTAGTRPDENCAAVLLTSLRVAVADSATNAPLCDASVSAVSVSGPPLALQRAPDGCTFISYEGSDSTFTVSATKEGYRPGSTQVPMRKAKCGFVAPDVRLLLEPIDH